MADPIFRGYDRAALDAQYNNRAKVPAFAAYVERWLADGERARATHGRALEVRYGASERQSLNVLAPAATPAPAPVLVYIHGGYWMSLAKAHSDFVALGLVPHGAIVVNVDYDLMPGVRMDALVAQCRAAVGWALANASSFGGDPARVWVGGHSAGGHLTAAVAATDWAAQPGVPAGRRPAGGFAFSGLFDLEPIRLCYLNDTLGMDAAEAARNAPLGMAPPADGDWTLLVGGAEGAEYLRQSVELGAAWGSDARRRVRVEVTSGDDHFSIVAPLADPGSALVARLVAQMGPASR
ncbi:MAG TPA: alpha/beta hydrolase [Burkholderiaceae bacterium]|nr:alpha/beta hydrolase [Burkholderiaceae bacterium]